MKLRCGRQEHYAGLEERKYLSLAEARKKRFVIDFNASPPAPKPAVMGKKEIVNFPLEELLPYIDWNPFFSTWQLRGKYPNRGYPKIFKDANVGAQAKELFDEAQEMLKQFIADKSVEASGE